MLTGKGTDFIKAVLGIAPSLINLLIKTDSLSGKLKFYVRYIFISEIKTAIKKLTFLADNYTFYFYVDTSMLTYLFYVIYI